MYFDQVAFGKRLKELREERGLRQDEVAEILNCSRNHYGHMEQGRKGCSIDTLLDLAELYQVSTDYLLSGKIYNKEAEIEQLKDVITTLQTLIRRL